MWGVGLNWCLQRHVTSFNIWKENTWEVRSTTTQPLKACWGDISEAIAPNVESSSFNHWQLLDETGDQRWTWYCLQMHVPHDPFNFFFESHVAPANTWHCPIRWGIKGSYKPHPLGPTHFRNATLSLHCTSSQELAPVTHYCLLVEWVSLLFLVFSSVTLLALPNSKSSYFKTPLQHSCLIFGPILNY